MIGDDHSTMRNTVLIAIVEAQEVVTGSTASLHSVLWISFTFAALRISQGRFSWINNDERMRPEFP